MKFYAIFLTITILIIAYVPSASSYWSGTSFPADKEIVESYRISMGDNFDLMLLCDDGCLYIYKTISDEYMKISHEMLDSEFITDFTICNYEYIMSSPHTTMMPYFYNFNVMVLTENDDIILFYLKIDNFGSYDANYDFYENAAIGKEIVKITPAIEDVDMLSIAMLGSDSELSEYPSYCIATDKGLYYSESSNTYSAQKYPGDFDGVAVPYFYKEGFQRQLSSYNDMPRYVVNANGKLFKQSWSNEEDSWIWSEIPTDYQVSHVEYLNGERRYNNPEHGLISQSGEWYIINNNDTISGPIDIGVPGADITTVIEECMTKNHELSFVGTNNHGIFRGSRNPVSDFEDISEGLGCMSIRKLHKGNMYLFAITDSGMYRSIFNVEENIWDNVDTRQFVAQIYPNPAGDNITVTLPYASGPEITVTISDLSGRLVTSIKLMASDENSLHVNTSGLLPGPYVLKVQTGGRVAVGLLMKK